jgi:hypothetical protein
MIPILVSALVSAGKRVIRTSTTGIASYNIDGQTIHSWAGIQTGQRSLKGLLKKVKAQGSKALARWQHVDVLILDEGKWFLLFFFLSSGWSSVQICGAVDMPDLSGGDRLNENGFLV